MSSVKGFLTAESKKKKNTVEVLVSEVEVRRDISFGGRSSRVKNKE